MMLFKWQGGGNQYMRSWWVFWDLSQKHKNMILHKDDPDNLPPLIMSARPLPVCAAGIEKPLDGIFYWVMAKNSTRGACQTDRWRNRHRDADLHSSEKRSSFSKQTVTGPHSVCQRPFITAHTTASCADCGGTRSTLDTWLWEIWRMQKSWSQS